MARLSDWSFGASVFVSGLPGGERHLNDLSFR